MTTWAEHIASGQRRWHLEVRIGGHGLALSDDDLDTLSSDGRYRHVIEVPTWAAGTAAPSLYLPDLALPLPTMAGEEGDDFGGLALYPEALTAKLAASDTFLALVKPHRAPVAVLTEDLTEAGGTIAASPGLTIDQAYWLGDECVRVDEAPGSGPQTCVRGYLSTRVGNHYKGAHVYDRPHTLIGQVLELWAGPAGGGPDDLRLLHSAQVRAPVAVEPMGRSWSLGTEGGVEGRLSVDTPAVVRSVTLRGPPALDGAIDVVVDAPAVPPQHDQAAGFVLQWVDDQDPGDPVPQAYARTDKGEVVGLRKASTGGLRIVARDLLGLGGLDPIEAGTILTQVFVAESLRYSPGPTPEVGAASGMRGSSGWVSGVHLVDALRILLTSPASPLLPAGNNSSVEGNWSVLPGGYGWGVPVANIKHATFATIKARRPDLVLPAFVWPPADDKPTAPKDTVDGMCKAAGIRVHFSGGLIALTMSQMPTSSASLLSLSLEDGVLADITNGTLVPRLSNLHLTGARGTRATLTYGPTKQTATAEGTRGGASTDLGAPWALSPLPWLLRAVGRLAQLGQDAWEFTAQVSVAKFFGASLGGFVSWAAPMPLNLREDGTPGPRQAEVMGLALHQSAGQPGADGVVGALDLRLYPAYQLASLTSPSAIIVSNDGGGSYTVSVQDYSLTDGGTNDGGQFAVGDTVARYNGDGTVDTGLGTVASFTPPATLVLTGASGWAAGQVIGYPGFDDTPPAQRASYLYLADLDPLSPSASAPEDNPPYMWGDL